MGVGFYAKTKITLTGATHQLILKAYTSGGTAIAGAGAGGTGNLINGYIRVSMV
jgi:hypothetical protein